MLFIRPYIWVIVEVCVEVVAGGSDSLTNAMVYFELVLS